MSQAASSEDVGYYFGDITYITIDSPAPPMKPVSADSNSTVPDAP